MLVRHLGLVGMAAIAMTVAACASSSSGTAGSGTASTPASSASAPAAAAGSSSAASGSTMVKTTTIGGQSVLTNAAGLTLYWFVPDSSTKSVCNGSCATYWPPVKGPVTAGSGVSGTLGTITRADGSTQATYDGHPLYTYVADNTPGQAKGNGLNESGGLWYEMTASGSKPAAPAAPAASPSTSKGGGGYGY
jgi:predicted lipoprotein with Yx(FWY)xxD motif